MSTHLTQQAIYPSAELVLIAEFMHSQGIQTKQWLMGTGLDEAHFAHPEQSISFEQFDVIYRNVYRLVNKPAPGLHLGEKLNISRWGLLTTALVCSQTLETGLYTASLYKSLLRTRFHIETHPTITNGLPHLRFTVSPLQHLSFPVNHVFAFEIFLASLQQQISDMLGKAFHFSAIGLPFSHPYENAPFQSVYAKHFKCNVLFDQAAGFYDIPMSTLKTTLPLANRANKRLALLVSEQELRRIEDHWRNDIPSLVLESFSALPEHQWNLSCISHYLSLSPRTLRRKLQDHGTCFRTLKHQFVMTLAMQSLQQKSMTIEQVATKCGYQDVNSFRVAFKHYTGQLPSEFYSSS